MAPNFNPSEPCAIGPEWMPHQDSMAFMGSTTQVFGAALASLHDESIANLWWGVGARFTDDGVFACEIFDITGDALPAFSDLDTFTYLPNLDLFKNNVQGRGPFSGFADTTTNIYQAISDVANTTGTDPWSRPLYNNSYLRHVLTAQRLEYACAVGGMAGSLTGRWVSSLVVNANVCPVLGVQGVPTMTIECYLQLNGTRYSLGTRTPAGNTFNGFDLSWSSFANPATGAPWTAGDVEAMDDGSGLNSGFGFVVSQTSDENLIPLIVRASLDVISSPTDERLAFGYLSPAFKQGWQSMALRDPATGAVTDWVKEAGHKYLFCIRETKGFFPIAVVRVDEPGRFLPGPPFWSSYMPETTAQGEVQPSIRPRALGVEQTVCYALALQLGDDSFSLDSQPYFSTSPTAGIPDALPEIGAFFDNAPVNVGRSIEQEFTPSADEAYGWLQLKLAQVANTASGRLVAQILDRATDTVQLTFHVTTDDMVAEQGKRVWQRVGVRCVDTDPVLLQGGEQYYVRLTSTAVADTGWLAQVLNGGTMLGPPTGPPPAMQVANFGGDDNRVTIDGVEQDHMDLEFVLSSLPPVPIVLDAVAGGEVCGVDFVNLSWLDPGGIDDCGLGFAAWEVQRSYDEGETWYRIKMPTDQATLSIDDYEVRSNFEMQYRLRTIRADGARSDWSDVVSATPTQSTPGLILTSNVMPELSLFCLDIGGERPFEFLENQTQVQPRGRKFQIVFRELEDRGDRFPAKLLVRAGSEMCTLTPCFDYDVSGREVFAPVLRICREPLPYVCVRNEAGDVWFANIASPSGMWRRSAYTGTIGDRDLRGNYTLDIVVTEVTDRPFAPDVVPTSASGSGSGSGA